MMRMMFLVFSFICFFVYVYELFRKNQYGNWEPSSGESESESESESELELEPKGDESWQKNSTE